MGVQYGALPYRLTKARAVEVLLVTSRETKRWVIPKGWPIEGLDPTQVAAREAYEEAGVRGTVHKRVLGSYSYNKEIDGKAMPCRVSVFALLVKRNYRAWPEDHQRRARWVNTRKAHSLVSEAGLRALISEFGRRASVWAGRARMHSIAFARRRRIAAEPAPPGR